MRARARERLAARRPRHPRPSAMLVDPAAHAEAVAWRAEQLGAWQRHYHIEPRGDSRLAELFVQGQVAMRADEVARELMCTDFLYKRTLYGDLLEGFLRRVAARLRQEHELTWTATWSVVRFYGPLALKLMCLSSSGLYMPEHLPDPREEAEA